jgi:hypothetical protein
MKLSVLLKSGAVILLALALVSGWAVTGGARAEYGIWHVAVNGSDTSGDGSETRPFATIQHGIDAASDDDLVLVHPGIYRMYSYGSVDLQNVVVSHNSAGGDGAGIHFYHAEGSVRNALISDNLGSAKGGGLGFYGSSPAFINVTIAGNHTTGHGGGLNVSHMSQPTLVNTIVWANTPEQIYFDADSDGQAITVRYSDVQGGKDGIVTNGKGTVEWGPESLDVSPRFAHAGLGNYRLTASSPVIGRGTADGVPDWDIEVNPRPAPAVSYPDMGAYEHPLGGPLRLNSRTHLPLAWGPSPGPDVFWADRYELAPGECTVIHWSVALTEDLEGVYLDAEPVAGQGSRSVCPIGVQTYVLRVFRTSIMLKYTLIIQAA